MLKAFSRSPDALRGHDIWRSLRRILISDDVRRGVCLIESQDSNRIAGDLDNFNATSIDYATARAFACLHGMICAATGNGYLAASIQRIRTLPLLTERGVKTFFAEQAVVWWDRAAFRRSQDEHLDIVEAILSRQGARAEAVMREHIARAGRLIDRKLAVPSEAALALP